MAPFSLKALSPIISLLPQGMHELIYVLLPTFFARKSEVIMRLKEIQQFIEKEIIIL